MGLREIAEADLGFIMEDRTTGFGWDFSLIDPGQVEYSGMIGLSTDIAMMIDPETGMAVSGRTASLSIRLSTLIQQGIKIPRGIQDYSQKPWIVEFADILGKPHTFKVTDTRPDYALGVLVCMLEVYRK